MDTALRYPQDLLLETIGMLDALPDGIRAMLSAVLLVGFLRFLEVRIPRHEIQYGQSFRKAALTSLLLIPLLVWLFPASRMIVFVEELTPPRTDQAIWLLPIAIWLSGAGLAAALLIRCYLSANREAGQHTLTSESKLITRLEHWAGRLGFAHPDRLQLVEVSGHQAGYRAAAGRIAIPTAAQHWPGNQQDVLLILSLCQLTRHQRRWYLIGQIVSCVYWPLPWTQSLAENLQRDLRRSADELAESCYQDRLGYARALRQLEQRLSQHPAEGQVATRVAAANQSTATGRLHGFRARLAAYTARIGNLGRPSAVAEWRLDELLVDRGSDNRAVWTDPYDRVVLFVGQAVFLAFLLTGVTLRERPPEIDYEYSMPFELLWKEHFHRNQELLDKTTPSSG